MKHLESAGHRGHGTERTLEWTMGTGACSGTHENRVRQLSDGAMTGGSQPTNIRGIDRRGKVPGDPLTPGACFHRRAGPYAGTPRLIDRSIHIRKNTAPVPYHTVGSIGGRLPLTQKKMIIKRTQSSTNTTITIMASHCLRSMILNSSS